MADIPDHPLEFTEFAPSTRIIGTGVTAKKINNVFIAYVFYIKTNLHMIS
jgi:hypothetical protein